MGTEANIKPKLSIQNTLFVSKNGNDTTGKRNRWDKPYLTIFAATTNALAGDTVYVYPGVYSEGANDIIKSDVNLFLELGSTVICDRQVISDYGIAKNINVDGLGNLQCTLLDFGKGIIDTSNPDTVINVKCRDLSGAANGVSIQGCKSFNIEVRNIFDIQQYSGNFRGNIQGTFTYNEIESTDGAALIFRNLGTDLVKRRLNIYGKYASGRANTFGGGIVNYIDTFNSEVNIYNTHFDHTVGDIGGIFLLWSGYNLIKNVTGISQLGYGIQVSSSSNCVIQIDGSTLAAQDIALNQSNQNSKITAKDSVFIANNQTASGTASLRGAIEVSGTGELDLDNCTLVQESTLGLASILSLYGNNVRLRSCKLVGDVSLSESIRATAPRNISIELQCVTNLPTSSNITNIIPGTSVIVNANVSRNSDNYFKN